MQKLVFKNHSAEGSFCAKLQIPPVHKYKYQKFFNVLLRGLVSLVGSIMIKTKDDHQLLHKTQKTTLASIYFAIF